MRGCVTKRGKTWAFVVEVGKHPVTGKRKQKWSSGYTTKAQAEQELAKMLARLADKENIVEQTNETVANYLENWLVHKKGQIRPGTYATYESNVRVHIVPSIGHLKLHQLNPQQLLHLYQQALEDGLAAQTIKHIHKILHDALETAVKWGLITRNIVKLVKAPKVVRKEMKVWNEQEIDTFLKHFTNPRYRTIVILALATGMRRGEILALKWSDIDWDKKQLAVKRSYVKHYKGHAIQEPKSAAGYRTIALSGQTIKVLRQHRLWQLEDRLSSPNFVNQDYVFSQRNGDIIEPQQFSGSWAYFFRKHTIVPKIRFHDLRHTHASLLLKAGIHPKVVSERLGHSSITITLDRYSHLLPGMQEAAAKAFDTLLVLPTEEGKREML